MKRFFLKNAIVAVSIPAVLLTGASHRAASAQKQPRQLSRTFRSFFRPKKSIAGENFLLITIDCGRYDAFVEARKPAIDKIGKARQAYTHGTFTYPAHAAMFQGMLPHVFSQERFYNRSIRQLWRIRGKRGSESALIEFPRECDNIIEGFVRDGYYVTGTAAMAWFRHPKPLRHHFPQFEFTGIDAKRQIDFILSEWKRRDGRPFFGFINFGEAHGPYIHPGMAGAENVKGKTGTADFRLRPHVGKLQSDEWKFDDELWRRQAECISYLDARIGDLLDALKQDRESITIVLCSDHGECFGEEGLYGHGFYHPKVMEVPLLIFRLNEDGTFTDDPDEIARRIAEKMRSNRTCQAPTSRPAHASTFQA